MLIVKRDLSPFPVGVLVIVHDVVPEASEQDAYLDGPACNEVVEAN
jgi:hypothetical protein